MSGYEEATPPVEETVTPVQQLSAEPSQLTEALESEIQVLSWRNSQVLGVLSTHVLPVDAAPGGVHAEPPVGPGQLWPGLANMIGLISGRA